MGPLSQRVKFIGVRYIYCKKKYLTRLSHQIIFPTTSLASKTDKKQATSMIGHKHVEWRVLDLRGL